MSLALKVYVNYVLSNLRIWYKVQRKLWQRFRLFFLLQMERQTGTGVQPHRSLMPMSRWQSWLGQRAAGVRLGSGTRGLIRFSCAFQRAACVCVCAYITTLLCATRFTEDCIWNRRCSINSESLRHRLVMETQNLLWLGSDVYMSDSDTCPIRTQIRQLHSCQHVFTGTHRTKLCSLYDHN